jgi:hypothetical protein
VLTYGCRVLFLVIGCFRGSFVDVCWASVVGCWFWLYGVSVGDSCPLLLVVEC